MKDLARREFWQAKIPLWRVIVIVLAIGTAPSFAAAAILSARISDEAHSQLARSQTQVRKGCERSNALRRLLNNRANRVAELQRGVSDFMVGSYKARRNPHSTSYDPKLADRYQRDISRVAAVRNEQLPIINCARAFKYVSADGTIAGPHTAALVR